MHLHLRNSTSTSNHLPIIISEIVVPCAHLNPLANGNLGPPDVADEDRSYTATLFRLHGVWRVLSLLSRASYRACKEVAGVKPAVLHGLNIFRAPGPDLGESPLWPMTQNLDHNVSLAWF
jgi:hypothetical protein